MQRRDDALSSGWTAWINVPSHHKADATGSSSPSPDEPSNRWKLFRWSISSATLGVPQAAGPIAFSLLALSLTGDASGGAAMILAMTLAQVVGAIPIARLGRDLPAATFLKRLIVVRTLALASIALLRGIRGVLPLAHPVCSRCRIGQWRGLRVSARLANQLAPASRLPRALGIAATLNEVTFVLAPVAASGLGTISPVFAVLALAALGAVPALLVPHAAQTHIDNVHLAEGSILRPSILLWLTCAAAGGATVAAIEIGAVALALNFGYEPALAIMFTVPLCLTAVAGGIWISVRNRMASGTPSWRNCPS